MKCLECQGSMTRGTAPFHVDRKGYHLLFDKVPAWVCSQCGEVLFGETEVETIQSAIESVDRSADKMTAIG
jgi:YgiT-type zinc finger domain-containing protein